MRIGQLADHTGLNPKTVRYYEQIGLLPQPQRTPSGYRDYDHADVERLLFVRRAQLLGFPLDDIREILALREQERRPCARVVHLAERELADVDGRIRELTTVREELSALLERAAGTAAPDHATYCPLIAPPRENGCAPRHLHLFDNRVAVLSQSESSPSLNTGPPASSERT